ncbi:MAG: hypothetical protein B1H02_07735 [Candidatus Latescibacteria bacterium 4484_107]|nr:MAG: hypothetical protein B1H02_07735 [Candidatus Latescibacteria bacterium 4484_107]
MTNREKIEEELKKRGGLTTRELRRLTGLSGTTIRKWLKTLPIEEKTRFYGSLRFTRVYSLKE